RRDHRGPAHARPRRRRRMACRPGGALPRRCGGRRSRSGSYVGRAQTRRDGGRHLRGGEDPRRSGAGTPAAPDRARQRHQVHAVGRSRSVGRICARRPGRGRRERHRHRHPRRAAASCVRALLSRRPGPPGGRRGPARPFIAAAVLLGGAVLPAATQSYHVARSFRLAGDGGWDYLALDTVGHRLFIAHQDRVIVVDPDSGKVLGEIPGLNRAHGVAFAYEAGHGFATSGADSTVTMFDLKSLRVLGHTMVPPDDDAVLYDPATKRIFTFNGDAHSATAIDAVSGKRLGDIELGAGPEFGVSAGDGKLFVNLEDKNAVAELDAAAMRV